MTRFIYRATDTAGFVQSGSVEAGSRAEAVGQLFTEKLRPLEISTVVVSQQRTVDRRTIRQSDLVAFVRELSTLLTSGVGLTESFNTLHQATTNVALQEALSSLIFSVQSGETFSVALRGSNLQFPEFVFALARAGEATGDIGGALRRCADQLEFEQQMQSQTQEALIYPAILILTGIAAIGFIFTFVVPRFAGLLTGRKVDLPLLSSLVLSTGMFVNQHWVIFLVVGLGLSPIVFLLYKNKALKKRIVETLSYVPLFSNWLKGADTARWTSTLAVLIQSRVPILLALELASTSVQLRANARRLHSVEDEVRLGKNLSTAIEELSLLEGTPLSMLKVGEKTGDLAAMLGHISSHSSDRHQAMQRRLVALIEPISILIIGLVIGIIMVGVVLAMTSLTEVKL